MAGQPTITNPPPKKKRLMKTRWFPLIRPAIKPLFLGLRSVAREGLVEYQICQVRCPIPKANKFLLMGGLPETNPQKCGEKDTFQGESGLLLVTFFKVHVAKISHFAWISNCFGGLATRNTDDSEIL